MYHCGPHHRGQMENSTVKEVLPGEDEAPRGPETPAATQQGLKGAGERAEGPGALKKQEIPNAGQRHHQDNT